MVEGDRASFRTVAARGRDAFAIRGSEFVGYAAPTRSIDDAEAFVDEIRAAHPDATHVVPAYRVRVDDDGLLREYESDAAEPTGSAGKPALTVLVRRDVENVAVAVVRYFGGTKLGVGGLARAYARATASAVDAAGVVETVPHRDLAVEAAYDDSGTVRGILASEDVSFDAEYAERVRFVASIPTADVERVVDRLLSATRGRVQIETVPADG